MNLQFGDRVACRKRETILWHCHAALGYRIVLPLKKIFLITVRFSKLIAIALIFALNMHLALHYTALSQVMILKFVPSTSNNHQTFIAAIRKVESLENLPFFT